ncbi:hypothetical protein LJC74_05970 [Eubacteriales bacterium OttesenSCG-928-A19]|nr:hypothetical protein [Eubacteriales bacterium OttesenSCG-928-A19]
MRRVAVLLLLLGCLLAAPCHAQVPGLSEDDFVFHFGGGAYRLGEEAAPFLLAVEEALGPLSVYSAESCLFTGEDREYACDALLVATYPIGKGGADVLETIYVLDSAYPTARGVSVGASRQDVLAAYGDGYTQAYDEMTYAMGDPLTAPVLVFVLDLEADAVSGYYMMRNAGG